MKMKTINLKSKSKIIKVIIFLLMIISFSNQAFSQLGEDWVRRYNFDKDDKAQAMVIDREGNIIITGLSEGKNSGKDFLTIKYSQDGDEVWSQRYEGFGESYISNDEARAIAVDEKNNIYVTGSSSFGRSGTDFCTIKYNAKGVEEWISYFSGSGNLEDSWDEATSITADAEGNVYVIGNSNGAGSGFDICIVKYDNNGNEIWNSRINGSADGDDKAVSVKADKSGFVYVAGTTSRAGSGLDYTVAKYDKAGQQEWIAEYNGVGGNAFINDDEVSALVLDNSGNAYVTGYSYGGITGKDFCTVKYNYKGQQVWVSRIDNSQLQKNLMYDDEAKAIEVSGSGEVFVTGKTTLADRGSDFFTVKIGVKGNKLWTNSYNGKAVTSSRDESNAIVADSKGNVYVTGFVNGESEILDCGNERGVDFCTIKYSSAGKQRFVKEYNGTGGIGNNDDEAKGILLDSKGKIYVMGESMGDGTGKDYCLVRYSEYYPAEESMAENINKIRLNDNFPNPFNPTTKISFNLPVSSNVKLSIYDISGREVALLENNVLQSGNYQYEWNAAQYSSGTYFYRIEAEGFVQTKKMLLIK